MIKPLFIFLSLFFIQTVEAKPLVVTTFSILKDWVHVLAGDDVDVISLVGPNQDAHMFEPKADALKTLIKADLIVVYGFGFESWFERLQSSLPPLKHVIYATRSLVPHQEYDDSLGREMIDPHGWHDLSYAIQSCHIIADALQDLIPHSKEKIIGNKNQYIETLQNMDKNIRDHVKTLKESQKIIVTSHDGFSYFAKAYGITVLSLQGLSTEGQPSAKMMAALIKKIKETKVNTVFLENITNPALISQLSQETGAALKGPLYSDALSYAHEKAPTFLDLMHHNVGLFMESMKTIATP